MHPHGGYKYAYPEDRDGLTRSAAKARVRREIEREDPIHPAEVRLLACDASGGDECPLGCGGDRT
jgi:hypothetical protein